MRAVPLIAPPAQATAEASHPARLSPPHAIYPRLRQKVTVREPEAAGHPGARRGEERLTLGEILALPLEKVELVVLSSCDSARGEQQPGGTEVMSLAQVFSGCSGVAATMASLWKVPDEAAEAFLVPFFKEIAAGRSKGEALQRTQQRLLRHPRYRHPFFWAPYVLMGDWR